MFFSGDPSNRKRVDLGGRSSKERDRQKLLEQTRLERNKRLRFRQENSAATKIQKCFRGRRAVEAERSKVREQFFSKYGKRCQNVDRHCFGLDSDLLRQFFFFFNPRNAADFSALVEACRLLQQFVKDSGDILILFGGTNHMTEDGLVVYRMKRFAYACIQAVYQKRNQLKDQLFMSSSESSNSTVLLLESLVMLIEPKVSWACAVVSYLMQRNVYFLIREISFAGKESRKFQGAAAKVSSLEHVLVVIMSHIGQKPCICATSELHQTFISQILTIPFLWQLFPYLKQIFTTKDLSQQYIHHMTILAKGPDKILPADVSAEFPSYACLLGNLLDTAALAFAQPDCSLDLAMDFTLAATSLLEELAPFNISNTGSKEYEDEMDIDEKFTDKVLNGDLKQQISNAIDPRFLLQLTNILFRGFSHANGSFTERPIDKEVAAVSAACSFLHVTFNILPLERIMTVLAYRTEIIPVLWNFMKRCHENKKWSSFSEQSAYLPSDAPGWLLPLAVFCPIYKHMLMIVDNEEFYEQEKPLSLKDIRCLIVILRQALWQLLWLNPPMSPSLAKSVTSLTSLKSHPVEFIQHRVSIVASELLSQLQDWNNRRQFTPPSDFQADGVNEHFNSQAMIEGSRAYDVLKRAPFLVPFTSRVKIFTSQLAAAKESGGSRVIFTGNRFRIRRDHILEDAFSQLSTLSEEDLKAAIRVTFVNEFGVEEAGIDGGGIFKDFMENISRAAFDAQYGLFKETTDHLLYPNPGSAMVHEQHLQFFHFLGTVLAKAMFEGILVDIPFATFFLSKLKQKHNYLNDLPSLDPELYRHLIFLKRYEGDISELELYFVIVNNEYGEQTVEDLLPGGKNIRVTNENVITFIHLVANHRLNYQIRQQSSHFYRGFQQLIQKDWIDMFNEHELQLMISGSVDGIDLEDLRSHTNYAGGYHREHYVIDMFWEVLKTFSMENQRKFLKFVTGCSRGPLLGFKHLEPLFCIQRAGADASEEALDRLPTSATCMNLLKLPPYRSKEQMERKLLYSINADAGFDLS